MFPQHARGDGSPRPRSARRQLVFETKRGSRGSNSCKFESAKGKNETNATNVHYSGLWSSHGMGCLHAGREVPWLQLSRTDACDEVGRVLLEIVERLAEDLLHHGRRDELGRAIVVEVERVR